MAGTDQEAANNPNSLVETSDGGYALVGYTGTFFVRTDFWLVKTDANGNMVWNQTYGDTGDEQLYSLVETPDGSFVLAGYQTSTYAGPADMWLIKTDAYGYIPEFPSWIPLLIMLIAVMVIGVIYKRSLRPQTN